MLPASHSGSLLPAVGTKVRISRAMLSEQVVQDRAFSVYTLNLGPRSTDSKVYVLDSTKRIPSGVCSIRRLQGAIPEPVPLYVVWGGISHSL